MHREELPTATNRRYRFTPEEDRRLEEVVRKHRPGAWDEIAETMGNGRTPRQVRERWQGYLNPTLELAYDDMQDRTLLALQAQMGNQWGKIAADLEGNHGSQRGNALDSCKS
jgi:hypothetical protein